MTDEYRQVQTGNRRLQTSNRRVTDDDRRVHTTNKYHFHGLFLIKLMMKFFQNGDLDKDFTNRHGRSLSVPANRQRVD